MADIINPDSLYGLGTDDGGAECVRWMWRKNNWKHQHTMTW